MVRPSAAQQRARVPGDVGADLAAQLAHRSSLGGSSASHSRVSRPAPSGRDCATSGASSDPAAISREPPPMSKTSEPSRGPAEPAPYGEEGQPGLVLTGQHADVDPGPLLTCPSTASVFSASRTAEVAKPRISSQPLSSATFRAGATKSVRASIPARVTAVRVEVLGEPERLLVGVRRHRRGAPVRVDDEQVSGVRDRCPALRVASWEDEVTRPARTVAPCQR